MNQFNYDNIKMSTLFFAMKESYKNAEQYYYEAELLYRIKSYGHSFSLSVIGLEELAKSYVLFNMILSKFEFNENKERSKQFNDSLMIIFKKHSLKQQLSFDYSLFSHLLLKDLILESVILMKTNPDKLSKKELVYRFKRIVNNTKSRSKHTKRWEQEYAYINKIHGKRLEGMYVEIIPNNDNIKGPNSILAKEANKILNIFDKYLDLGEYLDWMTLDKRYLNFENNKDILMKEFQDRTNKYSSIINKGTE